MLSSKSVASFSKKLSAFSRQPSEEVEPLKVQGRTVKSKRWFELFDIQHSTFDPSPVPKGGFVPHSAKGRSFVIKQIGGFVFQKNPSFQLVRHQKKSNRRKVQGRTVRTTSKRAEFQTTPFFTNTSCVSQTKSNQNSRVNFLGFTISINTPIGHPLVNFGDWFNSAIGTT
ncbi:MAG: hypothetical protein ACLQOO_00505 [Terriglobia bacterium]